ncbi:shikimate dehydrogenase [Hyphococcus luteus]|uniref:Shikimate dehydrogenase (NADP(+)) n=1 Tax=Hyphococcus luteus TaxID=2058213 RepID=A0A2S7K6R3_9PROT|nr:shikimate dehydrogenase [Marinicaulis flavus]PQA88205.1 shikimate dehydrogenase [Marinicaulis flavus]
MVEKKNNTPILAGVVGWPVGHSLSPLIHGTWAKRAGVNGYYIPVPVAPDYDDFAVAMDALKTLGFAGVNITIPHKEHALRYTSEASDAARRAGAANMLTFGEKSYADNSDITGFTEAVRATSSAPGQSALVLGAGGAARGVVLALQSLGFADIAVANRTRAKSEELAKTFGLSVADWEDRTKVLENIDLLVNTTSLGMAGQPPLEIDLADLKPGALVADIVYAPLETPLLKAAKASGHKTVDGLAMLMHQAVPGFKTWFGGEAVVDDALRAVLVEDLNKRGGA